LALPSVFCIVLLLSACRALLWDVVDCDGKNRPSPEAIRSCSIRFNPGVLTPVTKRFELVLPDKSRLTVTKARDAKIVERGFVWNGEVEGDPHSTATFSVVGSTTVGDIVMSTNGKIFRLRAAADGTHVIEELDRKKFPRGLPSVSIQRYGTKKSSFPFSAQATCTDSPDRIDVLVVYTPKALEAMPNAGNVDTIKARINQAEEETNTSYAKSHVQQSIHIVDIAQVQYTEQGMDEDLKYLSTSDEIHALRNASRADALVLVTEYKAAGGLANQFQERHIGNADFAEYAFAVVPQFGMTAGYAFGHELGHLMGAQHEEAIYKGAFHFSRAYVQPTAATPCTVGWGTIMAANQDCLDCTILPYWSNPVQTNCGAIMGVVNERDNAETLRRIGSTVAKFRCSSPMPGAGAQSTPHPGSSLVVTAGTPSPSRLTPVEPNVKQGVKRHEDVLFDFDKASLRPNDRAEIDEVIVTMRGQVTTRPIKLVGHTDDTGTEAYNYTLGLRRAEAVRKYLVNLGVASNLITVESKGKTQPIATNKTADGRSKNRRVDIDSGVVDSIAQTAPAE
jgi:outer membrane protein OmpA-like peptidoglycan-associated protein